MHRMLLFLLFSSLSISVMAQPTASPATLALQQSCASDVQRLCPDVREPRAVFQCLGKNKDSISESCKEGLQRFAQASQQAQARGGGAMAAFGGMNAFSPPIPLLVMEGRIYPENHSPRMTDYRLNISSPVYKTETDTLSMSAAYGHLNFQDEVTLDSGLVVPTNLRRVEVGAQYFRQLKEKRSWNLRGSVGYAGDTIFENSRDMSFSMIGTYSYPGSEQGTWVLSVFFANNSPIGNFIPIPGFIYIYRTENFTGLFGIPIAAVQWTPAFPWSLSLSIFGPTLQSEVAYGSVDKFQVYTGFQFTQQLYMLESRIEDEDRLRIQESRALIGARTPLFENVGGEFQVGYGFERSVYMGDGMFNKDRGSVDLDSSIYFNVILRAIL